jgi:hypothetical protein
MRNEMESVPDDEEYMATGLIDRNIFRSRRGF